MDDIFASSEQQRLHKLSVEDGRVKNLSPFYSKFVRSLRFVLPLGALVMTAIILLWDEAGRRMDPIKKETLIPASANIQNELLKPVFNGVDDKKQPYTVTADRAVQGTENPDIVTLDKPIAKLTMNDGTVLDGNAVSGLYQQKSQKLNLEGDVELHTSDGYTLFTQELRIDIAAQKSYSGRDVRIEGKSGTLDAKGLEGDSQSGTLIFPGPAKVVLYNNPNPPLSKEATP